MNHLSYASTTISLALQKARELGLEFNIGLMGNMVKVGFTWCVCSVAWLASLRREESWVRRRKSMEPRFSRRLSYYTGSETDHTNSGRAD